MLKKSFIVLTTAAIEYFYKFAERLTLLNSDGPLNLVFTNNYILLEDFLAIFYPSYQTRLLIMNICLNITKISDMTRLKLLDAALIV